MNLNQATERLKTVYAAVRLMDEVHRPLVFSGGLERVDGGIGGINLIHWAFQVWGEGDQYRGLVQGPGQVDGPSAQGTLAYVVEWLCGEGAESLRALKRTVEEKRDPV